MAIFKCKMCGGDLNVAQGTTICECEFCGTTQTIPSADDERKTNLFNRANHLRRNSEFDRAIGVYESIIADFPNEAEAYWGLLLCKFGIEYVDDPLTGRKIATCHRTSYESILNDENYKKAFEYADSVARSVYAEEANYIDEVQKGILKIANNEKPYDVFICYKETDELGERTQDSVYAQDIYDNLTEKGMKVFFARITLEDKLGRAYEPYIFAALNSAKVMIVLGTKLEYFNAVWVKNEWMRYLALMKKNKEKVLIPVYKNIDPYDLPEAMAMLQAQDMSKIGFMQDLIRGIKKVVGKDEKPVAQTVIQQTASANVENLLKRGMLALEDEKWEEAEKCFENVLNENVEETRAYLGKLMIDLKYHNENDFETGKTEFLSNENYKKIQRFGDDTLKTKFYEYNLQAVYNQATKLMNSAQTDTDFKNAKDVFSKVSDYKDAQAKADMCETAAKEYVYSAAATLVEKAESNKKSHKYAVAAQTYLSAANIFNEISGYKDTENRIKECTDLSELYNKKHIYSQAQSASFQKDEQGYNKAIELLNKIKGFEDSDEKIELYKQEIQKLYAEQEKQANEFAEARRKAEAADRRKKTIIAISATAAVLIIAFIIYLDKVIVPNARYKKAGELAESGDYESAIDIYTYLDEYKDSQDKITELKYANANKLAERGEYKNAIELYIWLGEYKDSQEKLLETEYNYAEELANNGDIESAVAWYSSLEGYKDSNVKILIQELHKCNVGDIICFGKNAAGTPIKWQIFEKHDDGALVISNDSIANTCYHDKDTSVTWETCYIRQWLNNDFYNRAFSDYEKAMIKDTTLTNPNNPIYGTPGGNNTTDKLFLLSIDEAYKYFATDEARLLRNGSWWWLRTPGATTATAIYVDNYNGELKLNGREFINHSGNSIKKGDIRPALNIKY